jgi:hypothetical protein
MGKLLSTGYVRADNALAQSSPFNGELANSILCVIEETDLGSDTRAYAKIKDWVTASTLPLHAKYKTPAHVPNTTHWVQCANHISNCPIFHDDTRITMSFVQALDPLDLIPRRQLDVLLEKEAPDFLAELLHIEIPESNDRLLLPVINTSEKQNKADDSLSSLDRFIDEYCKQADGYDIALADFVERFHKEIDSAEIQDWGKIKVGKSLPPLSSRAVVQTTL